MRCARTALIADGAVHRSVSQRRLAVCEIDIGRITPAGNVTQFPVPTHNASVAFITAGPHGNLWFTESLGNKIGRLVP